MLSQFCIRRPIFASVMSILIVIAGLLAGRVLPMGQYPDITPPVVFISTSYEGADAQTLAKTVAAPIEDQLSGVEGLLYYETSIRSNGNVRITCTFEVGTNPNDAMLEINNRVRSAERRLPESVRQNGVNVRKRSEETLMIVPFYSPNGTLKPIQLADYVNLNVVDAIKRVPGVGDADVFGNAQSAMRIWLNPKKMAQLGITAIDVRKAIEEQNNQYAAGKVGTSPTTDDQQLVYTIRTKGQLLTPEEFGNITVRSRGADGIVRIHDIARVEVGNRSYEAYNQLNDVPSVTFAVYLQTGANAMQTAVDVKKRLQELSKNFPDDIAYVITDDNSRFVEAALNEVVQTLLEAGLLVLLVVYLFLQNWRATLIPMLAVPVSLIGTLAGLWALNFSLNTLTLFAMTLAIGIVVDDAIVVLENVERIMSEEGLTPREATRKSMGQIQGALVGIAMVLSAVFVPMAFFGGTTGAIYRQFSITIVAAMVLSVLVAMILTPALCATLLKPLKKGEHHGQKGFFAWFNQMFNRNAERYEKGVAKILHRSLRWIVIYVLLLGGMVFLFLRLPTSFLPLEDRGMFTTSVQLPSGSTQQQTLKVVEQIEKYYFTHEKDNIMSVFATVGSGPGGNGQNVARMFIRLKDWSERDSKTGTSFAIIERATKAFNKIKEARVIASSPPAISGLGSSAGFDMELQDHAGAGHDALMAARNQLLALAAENPELTRVRHNGLDDSPQLQIDIDQRKAQALGVAIDDINDTLQTAWGSSYVNDFMDRGRVKKVYVQAAAPYRMLPDDINLWYVRNKDGGMVPFSAFATSRWETGSPRLERYNGYSAVEIVGEAAPGVSTGTAMDIMESLVKQLPNGFGLEWTAMSYQERLSGAQAPALYAISLLVVFLCLAALYESWSVPFSVMLVVPLGVIGALLATWMRGLENDVYFQVGLLTVIGLSAKNAILIVEFANEMNQKGHDLFEATLHACRQRLRPILMTSLAFIFGVLPMATSTGAGSGGQHAVGTGVMGGMISATILAIYFVPLFFVLVRRRFPLKPRPE